AGPADARPARLGCDRNQHGRSLPIRESRRLASDRHDTDPALRPEFRARRVAAPGRRRKVPARFQERVRENPEGGRTKELRAGQHGDCRVSALLKVIAPGFYTTVQDGGRRGYLHAGVPVSGALDRDGFMLANALAGNDLNAASLEMIGLGPEFEVMASSVRVALVGGNGTIEIAGREEAIRCDRSVRLTKGETVRVRLSSDSFCSYL